MQHPSNNTCATPKPQESRALGNPSAHGGDTGPTRCTPAVCMPVHNPRKTRDQWVDSDWSRTLSGGPADSGGNRGTDTVDEPLI
jgi:hypothetical protein